MRAGLYVCVVAALALGVTQLSSTSAAATSLRVEAPLTATVGEPFRVSLWLHDASSVAGYEATVLFDIDAATFRSVEHRTNELARMGRDVQTLGPDEVPGGIAIGAYSCSYQDCVQIDALAKQQRGGTGDVRMTTFTLVPLVAGPLVVEVASPVFVDVDGAPLEVDLGETRFTIQVEGS